VLFNIPAATAGLPEGVKTAARLDTGGIHGANDAGKVGYVGPCPPPGPDHRYRITFYVLDTNLSLPPGSSASKVIAAMEGHILSQTRVTALYSRQP
jgi:Raf kinase inhibitor-like YbhB/YbcL family protein